MNIYFKARPFARLKSALSGLRPTFGLRRKDLSRIPAKAGSWPFVGNAVRVERRAALLFLPLLFAGCNRTSTQPNTTVATDNRVTLYCSVDQEFAKPLIERLEQKTGLQIAVLYDTEATKTAGLANRIRAERNRPRCDVYWASALMQTLLLSEDKLLAPYDSPSRKDVPARFRGKDWTGMGVRGRVVVSPGATTQSVEIRSPREVANLVLNPVAISNPSFGTASDWFCAYATRSGDNFALAFARDFKAAHGRVLPGNGDVARETASGNLRFGVCDTDDYLNQRREKTGISLVPTSKDNMFVPGAVSLVAGAPHLQNARKLLDALVSKEGEAALIQQMPGVFSIRKTGEKANWKSGGEDFGFLSSAPQDDYAKWPATWKRIREPLAQILTP